MPNTHTLVISDIHLGSTLSHAGEVVDFLKKASFKRLILLGDIFDGTHVFKFKKIDWELLDYLVGLKKEGKEVVWIRGNHDVVGVAEIPQLAHVEFVDSYCWTDQGKKYCAIHGHQFDRRSVKKLAIKKITDNLHSIFSAYMRHKKTASVLERFYTKFRRLSKKISKGAIYYASNNNIDYIFCAHTHVPLRLTVEFDNKKQINYFNSGSWIQSPFNYITIDEVGAKIGEFATS